MQPQTREPRYISPGAIAFVILLGLVAVAVLVIGNNVFSIKSIEVEGNRHIDDASVIELSGVHIGDSIFSINSSKIRDAINSDTYLEYVGLWKSYPDHLVLSVEEDTPRAQVEWMGTQILLGKDCVVLDRKTIINLIDGIPIVKVSDITSNIIIGNQLIAAEGQIEAVNQVLAELIAQNMLGEISELNATRLDNIYLITEDAVQVNLGACDLLPDKMLYMRAMLARLRAEQAPLSGAVLDITTGKFADYKAPSQ